VTEAPVLRDEPPWGGDMLDEPTRRPAARRDVIGDVVAVVGVLAVLGTVCGVLWWLLVEPAEFTKLADGGTMGEVELSRRFDADGWYTVLAAVTGFLAGMVITSWRDRDFRLTTVLLVPGAAAAAALMAVVGRLLGPGDPDPVLDAADIGARVPEQLMVTADAAYFAWPIAVLLGALVVLWSAPNDPLPDSNVDPDDPSVR
jgi:hypothetical protein